MNMPLDRRLLCRPPRCLTYDDQSCHSHHQHGDEPGEFSQNNGEHDEADERHADRRSRQCEEAATDAHELQRLLQTFENGITLLIHRHASVCGYYLKNKGRASDSAMNAIHPPMVSMMVFFTSWSPFCILK